MAKTEFIRARIEPELKEEVLSIFQTLGLSLTEAINLFFHMVKLNRGLPFEIKIPNEETLQAMEDAVLERNLEEWNSVDAFLESI
jgi:DNA-damage-inducible protein J